MHLRNCHNFHDFRRLAKRRLPGPIFDYIDGAADDEVTHRRNTKAFESCDLSVLRGVENVDLSVTVMGQKLALPVYCSPTALQRLKMTPQRLRNVSLTPGNLARNSESRTQTTEIGLSG